MITSDYHFELLPEVDATDGAAFGIGLDVSMDAAGFAPGATEWAVQDGVNSQNGATAFGRDRLLGPVWNWQAHINRSTAAEALTTLRAFKTAWHALHIRDTPGKVIPLRFQLEGERRRIYGRPRRFDAPPDNMILSGYVPVSIDFKCVDGFVYNDVMESVSVLLGAEIEDPGVDTGGGFVFPFVFPYTPLASTLRQTQMVVGGDAPAYPIIRFDGPVTNPGFITDDHADEVVGDRTDGRGHVGGEHRVVARIRDDVRLIRVGLVVVEHDRGPGGDGQTLPGDGESGDAHVGRGHYAALAARCSVRGGASGAGVGRRAVDRPGGLVERHVSSVWLVVPSLAADQYEFHVGAQRSVQVDTLALEPM